jgi:hypothetical protein
MNKLESLKCIEVTSQRQADNGTVCYHDPITNCDYLSYESGYVRRKYSTRNWRGYIINTIYQLNKTKMSLIAYKDYYGNLRVAETKQRILEMNPEARLEILARAVVNYRNTVKKYEQNRQAAAQRVASYDLNNQI